MKGRMMTAAAWLGILCGATAQNTTTQNTAAQSNVFDRYDVLAYRLDLDFTRMEQQEIHGTAEIDVQTTNAGGRPLLLELRGLKVEEIGWGEKKLSFKTQGDTLIVPLHLPEAGQKATLRVRYGGKPAAPDRFGGFYFKDGLAYNLGVNIPRIPHNDGKAWFPCQDDFTDKARFSYSVRVPVGYVAVCNGTMTDSLPQDDGTVVYRWSLRDPIPTYLASIAVGPYTVWKSSVAGQKENIPVSVYSTQKDGSKTAASFKRLPRAVKILESHFGPYAWERIGYVGVAMEGGAMEHACNIAYPDRCVDGTDACELLWVHELSHAWFGNLVTCATAGDMWLNEGFARYCEGLFLEGTRGRGAFLAELNDLKHQTLTNLPRREGFLAVADVPEDKTYSGTVYDKGALVVHALRERMGDSLFFAGIRGYLQSRKFGNATTREFRDALSAFTGLELYSFFDDWVHTPGYVHFDVRASGWQETGNASLVQLDLRQSVWERPRPVRHGRVDVWFFAEDGRVEKRNYVLPQDTQRIRVMLPIKPAFVVVDPLGKCADARVQTLDTVVAPGERTYLPQGVTMEYSSPARLAVVTRHYVQPLLPPSPPGRRFARHYRTVTGAWNQVRLTLIPDEYDYALEKIAALPRPQNLFFRPEFSKKWREIPDARIYEKDGKVVISVPGAQRGDYIWTYAE
jgi:aminopeptidase N